VHEPYPDEAVRWRRGKELIESLPSLPAGNEQDAGKRAGIA